MHEHMLWHVCGGQRSVCGSQFSPLIMFVPGTVPRLSGLAAGAFSEQGILPALYCFHIKKLPKYPSVGEF